MTVSSGGRDGDGRLLVLRLGVLLNGLQLQHPGAIQVDSVRGHPAAAAAAAADDDVIVVVVAISGHVTPIPRCKCGRPVCKSRRNVILSRFALTNYRL